MQWLIDGIGARLQSTPEPRRHYRIPTASLDDYTYQREQVICVQRGMGIRLSPHFYTSAQVAEGTLALLTQLAKG